MDQFEQIRFRSSPSLLVLYCYYNYSSFSVCFYRELKLAFEFVFKGRVSFGQPTRPRVLLGLVARNKYVCIYACLNLPQCRNLDLQP